MSTTSRRLTAATAALLLLLVWLVWPRPTAVTLPEPPAVTAAPEAPEAPVAVAPDAPPPPRTEVVEAAVDQDAEAEEPSMDLIRCALPEVAKDAPWFELDLRYDAPAGDGYTTSHHTFTAATQDGQIFFPADMPAHPDDMIYELPGFMPARANWTADGCTLEEPEVATVVQGTVVGPFHEATYVRVTGCDGSATVREPGASFQIDAPPDVDCVLYATRNDGLHRTQSPEVALTTRADGVTGIVLTLPKRRTGGLGVKTTEVEDGLAITALRRDAPAHLAGLRVGDVLLTVDGKEVDADNVTELMVGPEGDTLTLTVDRGKGPEEVTLTRDVVPSDQHMVPREGGGSSSETIPDAWIEA